MAARALVDRERQRQGISRREFLVGAALLAGCRAPAPQHDVRASFPRGGKVLVVGGGTAGLVCAYRLMLAGIDVEVLEISQRAGGRMYTDATTFGPDRVCELGGEFIDTGHAAIRDLAAELGLQLDDVKDAAKDFAAAYAFGGRIHDEAAIIDALRPAAALVARDVRSLDLDAIPYRSGPASRALDAVSIRDWLSRNGVAPLPSALLDVAFTTELGLDANELSCIPMLQMLALPTDAQEASNEVSLYGESDERFHVRGGNGRIPTILRERLGRRFLPHVALRSLSRRRDGRLELVTTTGEERSVRVADRVVLALPFTALRKVRLDASLGISPRKRKSIDELGYGSNAKVMLGFRERVWHERARSGESFADLPHQSSWDTTRAQPGKAGILTVFTGGSVGRAVGSGTDDEVRARMMGSLEKVFPGLTAAADGRIARFAWAMHPFTQASYSTWKVGQLTDFGGVEAEIEGGDIHFAGEHTSLASQGFMNGAVESGERAATEILQDAGVKSAGR